MYSNNVEITSATLTATLSNVNLTVGKAYSDGYVTLKMTSATAGTITAPDGLNIAMTVTNGELVGTYEGVTFKYKLLAGDSNTITLAQTYGSWKDMMNSSSIEGAPAFWSLMSSSETADTLPSSGTISVYNYGNIEHFGEENVKTVIDFTNKTLKSYNINGDLIEQTTFTVSGNTLRVSYGDNNYSNVQLMSNINGKMVFKTVEHYEYSWGNGSANGARTVKQWLEANEGYVYNNPLDNQSMKVVLKSGIVDYIERNDNGNVEIFSGSISSDGKILTVTYGDGVEKYTINTINNSIDVISEWKEIDFGSTLSLLTYTFVNTITGTDTNDIFNGNIGADTMIGGAGNDTYYVNNAGDKITENTNQGTDKVFSTLSYTLGLNLENLELTGTSAINATGNTLNNTIVGNSGNNILNGLIGADIMSGGLGNDTYYMDNIGDKITENTNAGTDKVFSTLSYALGLNLENLELTGTSAINATGNTLNNTIVGNSGNNILNGLIGADIMSGGLGNDTYYMDNIGDKITENTNAGTDKVFSTLSYALGLNLENLELTGTSAINATGNTSNNTIIGNSGNNIINGLAGADIMSGGLGNDTYYMDNIGDKITENTNAGTDKVFSTLSYALGLNLENLELTGTSAINATGNTSNNTIIGNSGNNIINGLAGADIMSGGTGKDTFVFNTALNSTTNKDTISDFRAIDDGINLENAIFTKLTKTGVLSSSNFKASINGIASDSNDYILYNTSNGNLSYDSDGNGSASAILFATLSSKPADLTYADFVII